jgi:tetratricopeptide (TPR) repeat protein
MRFFSRRLVCLAALGLTTTFAQRSPQTVAVLDFSIPTAESNRWTWAEGGIADLLQIELEHLGLVTLDRDFIRAVLAEQRLSTEGLTTPNQLKLAALLNARYLVSGRIFPLGQGRIRVEATAFSVEAIETVATAGSEGAFPKELPETVRSLARTLAGKLKAPGVTAADFAPPARAFNPEALIMFYRGLNACARGHPELGIACFINAESLDREFAAPMLWEIRGLEMAGFPEYAAIRREETAIALRHLGFGTTGPTNAAAPPAKPVLAVLAPVVPAGVGASNSLASVLKEALLATGRVHLFAFENIGDAVAEQDLRLSSLFANENAPRYGRWLASDALVACRVTSTGTNRWALDLSLADPLNGATLARVQRSVTSSDLPGLLRKAAVDLLDQWTKPGAERSAAASSAGQVDLQAGEAAAELRPAFCGLAAALAQVRREPGNSGFHRTLANALGATERPRLAAREIERCIETLDIHAPGADITYLHTHRWLFWEPSPIAGCGAVGLVDKRAITNLIQPLLSTYPESLAAGCMHYNLAIDDWHGTNWAGAAEHASRARQVMEHRPGKGRGDLDIIAAAYFLEGSSLRHLGRAEEAKAVLRQGQAFMLEFKVQGVGLPLGPYVGDAFGEEQVYGFGGDQPGLPTRIHEEMVLLEGKPVRPLGADLKLDAEDIVSGTNAPARTDYDWLQCAAQVLGILERVPAGQEETLKSVLASADTSLNAARSKGADDAHLRPLVQRFTAALLAKKGIPSFENSDAAPLPQLTQAATQVMSLYESAGLGDEGWTVLEPLFSDRYPAALTLNLLQQLHWDSERYARKLKQAAVRLRAGDATVPRATWLKLGQIYYDNRRYSDALDCYQRAVAKGVALAQCPGAQAALVEVALERNPAHVAEEIERTRQQLGFPPVEASVVEWFAVGRKYQAGRQYDLAKAILCYRQALEFLEHPEKGGVYHLEKQENSDRVSLRWGPSLGEVDMLWSENYDARWYSSAFYLAQCLIEVDRKEEAAQWLRRIAIKAGGDDLPLLSGMTWNGSGYSTVHLGASAAEMLKKLHLEPRAAKLGEAEGPYKLPPMSPQARAFSAPPLPAPSPQVLAAVTNALAAGVREPRTRRPNRSLQTLVRKYGHDAVPALLSFIPHTSDPWNEWAIAWMLDQTARPADAPWLVAACAKHTDLVRVAWKLDPQGAAEVLAEEWQAQSRAGIVSPRLVHEALGARVRPLYPLALELIAGMKVNHYAVAFEMDKAVREEKSEELEAAFHEALTSCLKLKLEQKYYYGLETVSRIALGHGVSLGIDGLLICEGATPAQLLKEARPFVDLPSGEKEAIEMLRANTGSWKWDPARQKFALPASKHTELSGH